MTSDTAVKVLEPFIKEVFCPDGDEAVPFGQTVADVGIKEPEVVRAVLKASNGQLPFETSILIIVRPLQSCAES